MKWIFLLLLFILALLPVSPAMAALTQDVLVTATPNVGQPLAPVSLIATYVSDYEIRVDWVAGANTENITLLAAYDRVPASRADGVEVYYGAANATTTTHWINSVGTVGPIYYRAFAQNAVGDWENEGIIEEANFMSASWLFMAMALIAIALTIAMFLSKSSMLGFPCAIFWAIFGGFCYQQSDATWDIHYLMFFGAMGMAIFSMFAAYGLRTKKEEAKEGDLYFDEGGDRDVKFIDESGGDGSEDAVGGDEDKPNRQVRDIRERASRRRSRWE